MSINKAEALKAARDRTHQEVREDLIAGICELLGISFDEMMYGHPVARKIFPEGIDRVSYTDLCKLKVEISNAQREAREELR